MAIIKQGSPVHVSLPGHPCAYQGKAGARDGKMIYIEDERGPFIGRAPTPRRVALTDMHHESDCPRRL